MSVVGVGGASKTRLAIEVARSLTGGYRDGAWLVELAPVASAASDADGGGVASAPRPPWWRPMPRLAPAGACWNA